MLTHSLDGYLVESGPEINDIGPNFSLWLMRGKYRRVFSHPQLTSFTVSVSVQTRKLVNRIGEELEDLFINTNMVTISEATHRSAPIGWLGRVGDLMLDCVQRFSDSLKPRLCEDWSMPVDKYDDKFKYALAECQEFKSWTNFYCVVARKNESMLPAIEEDPGNSMDDYDSSAAGCADTML